MLQVILDDLQPHMVDLTLPRFSFEFPLPLIRDKPTGTILFLGRVADPTAG